MIGFIEGKILNTFGNQLIVLTQSGVGYIVNAHDVFTYKVEQKVEFFILHVQREDKVELFGFTTLEERSWVERLLKVNGVGPKVAASIIFSLGSEKFTQAIRDMDVKQLQIVKGLGGKTAKKILLELKGEEFDVNLPHEEKATKSRIIDDFIATLENLGYKKSQSIAVHELLVKENVWNDDQLLEMVKIALKKLTSR